jgi:hypothetical protein
MTSLSIFFLFSALVELALVRHRRKEKRFGPGPANGYTSGSGKRRGGLFGFGRKKRGTFATTEDPNALPVHTQPNEVRDSYATEQTRVGSYGDGTTGNGYKKYGESGYNTAPAAAAPAPGATTDNHYYTSPHTAATAAHTAPEVNPYRSEVNTGVTGAPHGTHVNDTAHAQYPSGNYQYEDGVYNSRV